MPKSHYFNGTYINISEIEWLTSNTWIPAFARMTMLEKQGISIVYHQELFYT